MQSWVHMYDPGPPDGFGTCALEDQLEEQLLAETNKRLERDPDLSHAVFQRGPWRAPVLGGEPGGGALANFPTCRLSDLLESRRLGELGSWLVDRRR